MFLKIDRSQNILSFDDITVPKITLHNEMTNKTLTRKDQENSAHCFGDNYLANHLAKFLQYRIKP